mmetsp:Transcript_55455/g.129788  ORF Transcript_55455/g.129788 Transcript_55455/m.129788 type:complete len:266 (+) Transcript_55455:246-1043(+)|eukprot:CAMPEP_0177718842 /NCGR_PEP_ID=MMETSP0484_2-20121128/15794_1 /TAXON_ID=354590 /ORGANISM="Rhodomonas lens, Strain RHODO" /LENGTH=265 /DNA_ID=CAMNT_0019231037 /DNA_START=234 /DNA_END=1031 /DNA_ORIENTATION=-
MPKKIEAPEENPGTKKIVHVFSYPPPLCLGEPFNDKVHLDPRARGKNFSAGFWKSDEKTKICAPGNFKLLPFLFADEKKVEPFKEQLRYKDIYKDKGDPRPRGINGKLGFLSADFPKRDEYTNTIRTEQLREVLRREGKLNKRKAYEMELRAQKSGLPVRPRTAIPTGVGLQKMPLYDLVFRIPEQNLKHKRDDRQGRFFFMGMRQKQKEAGVSPGAPGTWKEPILTEVKGHAWVHVGMPSGHNLHVLLDENKQVIAKRPMSAHI